MIRGQIFFMEIMPREKRIFWNQCMCAVPPVPIRGVRTGDDPIWDEEAHICMKILKRGIPYRIDMHLKKNKSKGIAINGVPVKKAGELMGLGNFVFFSPEDLNIIKNGPSERRRFLDMELCQLDKVYLHHLASYNKILAQRNKLLKGSCLLSGIPGDAGCTG